MTVDGQSVGREHLLTGAFNAAIDRVEAHRITLPPGQVVGRHSHVGGVVGVVLEGAVLFEVDGQEATTLYGATCSTSRPVRPSTTSTTHRRVPRSCFSRSIRSAAINHCLRWCESSDYVRAASCYPCNGSHGSTLILGRGSDGMRAKPGREALSCRDK